jgi:protein-histidine pros-kinase
MKLIIKFNIIFLLVFALGFAAAAYVSNALLQKNAQDEIVQNARLIMESSLASRAYTSTQIAPLLQTQMKYEFLPQSVPAYGATEQFNTLHTKFPDFAYKEATLNPTNLRDRATEWEADLVNRFRQYPDQTEIVGERDTPNGRSLYMARPIQIKNPACLACHSTVDAAPKTLLDKYGSANGFGWQLNEIIGAQVVSVPTSIPLQRANQAFKTFMLSLGVVFVMIFATLNFMLWWMVVRPVTKLSQIADEISMGKMDGTAIQSFGKDEIGRLGQAFERMKKSLVHAMKMLEE